MTIVSRQHAIKSMTRAVKDCLPTDEQFEVELISGTFYIFSSELNTLRLLKIWRGNDKARQGFSSNLDKWYFSLETTLNISEV